MKLYSLNNSKSLKKYCTKPCIRHSKIVNISSSVCLDLVHGLVTRWCHCIYRLYLQYSVMLNYGFNEKTESTPVATIFYQSWLFHFCVLKMLININNLITLHCRRFVWQSNSSEWWECITRGQHHETETKLDGSRCCRHSALVSMRINNNKFL